MADDEQRSGPEDGTEEVIEMTISSEEEGPARSRKRRRSTIARGGGRGSGRSRSGVSSGTVVHRSRSGTRDRNTGICSKVPKDKQICAICYQEEFTDENKILFCDGCDVPFHQRCYNVEAIPPGDWFCDYCNVAEQMPEDEEEPDSTCGLCGLAGGGLIEQLREDLGVHFVHKICAVAADMSTTGFVTGTNLQVTIALTGEAPSSTSSSTTSKPSTTSATTDPPVAPLSSPTAGGSSTPSCGACGRSAGVLVKCQAPTCGFAYHPTCAANHGHGVNILFKSNTSSPPPLGRVVVYCPAHMRDTPTQVPRLEPLYLDNKLEIWEGANTTPGGHQHGKEGTADDDNQDEGSVVLVRLPGRSKEYLALPRTEVENFHKGSSSRSQSQE